MAKVPPEPIDFAPAWLNRSSSNKQKYPKLGQPLSSTVDFDIGSRNVTKAFGSSHKSDRNLQNFNSKTAGHQSTDCDTWNAYCAIKTSGGFSDSLNDSLNVSVKNQSRGKTILQATKNNLQREIEFPSLGSHEQTLHTSKIQANNVWRKPPVLKPTITEVNSGPNSKSVNLKSDTASSIYKSLVPKSTTAGHKQPYRRAVSIPNANKSAEKFFTSNIEPITSQNHANFKSQEMSSGTLQAADGHSMLALTVKRHRRGKNVFLQGLKCGELVPAEDKDHEAADSASEIVPSPSEEEQQVDCMDMEDSTEAKEEIQHKSMAIDYWDAVYDQDDGDVVRNDDASQAARTQECRDESLNKFSANTIPLSSSLEAEYRLLREMGWTRDRSCLNGDDSADEPPLTDDEIREFFTRNKRRGLLGVPSISHRTSAFRDALNTWSISNKQLRHGNRKVTAPESLPEVPSPRYSTDSQFSLSDSD
uniref:Vasculin n=1 Tax=Phallusia mammillata TaxID=59560 RepID=A0A6F9DDV2_9ASCI|nr:vasculin [Phallusia mammillata]